MQLAMEQEVTSQQYDEIIAICKTVFINKSKDYGTSWRVLRPISITDQIMIKALRIRNIQETEEQKIKDQIDQEFLGIVNYGIMALIQLDLPVDEDWELPVEKALALFEKKSAEVKELMLNKNHDYGEAWRQMSQQSFVDLILSKLQRIRNMISNEGHSEFSEGMDSNFGDIINYAVFALILIKEKQAA